MDPNNNSNNSSAVSQASSQSASQLTQPAQFASQPDASISHPTAVQSESAVLQQYAVLESEQQKMIQTEQIQKQSQMGRQKKISLQIIILLVLSIIGGILSVLMLTGIINFDRDSGSGNNGDNAINLSVPTAAKIKEVCEKNNGEYSETVSTIRRAFREILPNGTESITNHYCSIGIIITISDTDYLDLISMKAKQLQGAESEFPVRASSMAIVYTKVFSTSVKNPDGTIEEHKYTFTPIVDEIDYYKAYAGENGENDKGIFIVYKNAIVSASNAISDEYLNQLGLNKQ